MADPLTRKPSRSIKIRLLSLSIGMMAVAILVITALAIDSIRRIGSQAEQVSSQTISSQAEEYLAQITLRSARENDLVLNQTRSDVQKAAAVAAELFDHPGQYQGEIFWPAKAHMFFGPDGQYMNAEADITSVFVPDQREVDEAVIRDIEQSAYLDLVLPSIFKNNPNAEAIYFATPRDVVRYYPNVNLGKVLPPDFKASERVWFSGSTLQNDPQKGTWWTPVYLDATGLGLVTTAAAPVYDQNQELVGVVGFDASLKGMKANIEANQFLRGGYSFLVDQTGRAIALPEQGFHDILGRSPQPDEVGPDISSTQGSFEGILKQMLKGESGIQSIQVEGKKVFVAYTPLSSNGWSLASVVPAEDVFKNIPALQAALGQSTRSLVVFQILPVTIALFVLLLILGLMWTNQLVEPLQKLAIAAKKIQAGEWDVQIPAASNDEIGLLAHTFGSMTEQLHGLIGNLEQRVLERTHDLERRSSQIQTAAQVARDITTVKNLDELLDRAVHLIRDRFGYYHAGIFLVDELGEYAQLKAATGEAGRQMLEHQHKLKVGVEGLVGYTIARGEPRIALDVGADAVHFKNPWLPNTRSEMALPLKTGGQVIGALDVQSIYESAFDQEDINILQTLSDQLAVAIVNSRLAEQTAVALREINLLYQRQVKEAWQAHPNQERITTYEYDRLSVTPADFTLPDKELGRLEAGQVVVLNAKNNGNGYHSRTLIVPLRLRDELIGVIGIEKDGPDQAWSEDEIAIATATANEASLTLENARLLDETRRRAENEQLAREITARMRQTLDLDSVLQTAVKEMGQALGLQGVTVRLKMDTGHADE